MRVITAIYLHCRPELRDEWLAGMHEQGGGGGGDGEVEEAVPLEWALRGLTWWWQRRRYGDVVGMRGQGEKKGERGKEGGGEDFGGQEIEDEERDFFQRELDAVGWGLAGARLDGNGEGDVGFGEEAPGVVNGGGGNGNGGGAGGLNGSGGVGEGEWADARTLEAWQNMR